MRHPKEWRSRSSIDLSVHIGPLFHDNQLCGVELLAGAMSTKIVEITDLHIGDGLSKVDELSNLNAIVGAIRMTYSDEDKKPVVIVTGDITDSGTDKQLGDAKSALSRLYDDGFTVWPVPGNHDYGIKGMIDDKERIKAFKGQFFNCDKWLRPYEAVSYPHIVSIDDYYFIGLDSMKADVETPDLISATGQIGTKQLESLPERLDGLDLSGNKRIILFLHHHPTGS